MAEASISIDQEHFSCSICLYLLKEPVTTPCGHSFCMVCINGFWDEEDQKKVYSCPQCREAFAPRPVLRKSNVLTEIIDILQKTEQQTSFAQSLKIISHEAQDVECDSCIGVKEKAVKSCLTCLASYCDTHVQAHHESPAFKKHMLITALSNLQEKTCAQHCKLLEVFCRTDQRVICYQCSMDKHKDHDTVPVQDEWMEKKKYFGDLQQKHQNRLESREKTLLELKDVIEAYKRSAQEAVEDSDKVFAELLLSIEKRRSEVTELIRAQEKAELAQTAEVIKQLEQEIADLKRRQAGLEKLSQTTGYVHFLQRFQFLSPELETADTFKVDFNRQWSFENFKKSIIQLKEEIEDFCKEKVEKVSENAVTFDQIIIMPEPETREEFLKYSCELSLDPNTANYNLELSNDDTHVTCDNKPHKYPDHPERFTFWQQVLSKQSVSPRSYWEAEVDGENGVSIAVSYKDIIRKGSEKEGRFGQNAQSWRLVRYPKKYCFWQNDTKTDISGPISKRIGVYLDQKAGTLSFYSVSNKMTLIHKVTTTFTQPLYAGFGIGTGSSAKICLQASAAITAAAAAESLEKK
ncbi:tripartite motif-containing protein 16-like isoform X1 [Pangasianodon hypophthalmus]|uniref:tripartite motif-containing protein 16-like isoform X1 n=1 Tax=Pangasianodon hypophthalmus TaxID=310915 RepID=UPI000F004259|nr:tripartite motif-containing protein 16-like isoform X1 [Pangasianodon hypophthalmus]